MAARFLTGWMCLTLGAAHADTLLVEAEQFPEKGGWQVDTQFIESMGSPYLIAHGLGKPVADATTTVEIKDAGNYRIWVRTTWSIDLHYPREEYVHALPEHPFIARAVHGKGVNAAEGYPIPYRCFYSCNVPNLFMAGRNISVEREALGTIRVMKTIGMMGATVGRAAALAKVRDCSPREVYTKHLDEAKSLWRMPGDQRYADLNELRKALGTTTP